MHLNQFLQNVQKEYDLHRKIPLLLFSGGLDSTYLLYETLKLCPVDVLYIEGNQGQDKIDAEKYARENIIKHLCSGDCPNVTWDIKEQHVYNMKDAWIGDYKFAQLLPWFYGGMGVYDTDKHSIVAMSYVMGDDICSDIPYIRQAWDIMTDVVKNEQLSLAFPLMYVKKRQILASLPESVEKLTWVCETPVISRDSDLPTYTPCGHCIPCATSAAEKYKAKLLARDAVAENPQQNQADEQPKE